MPFFPGPGSGISFRGSQWTQDPSGRLIPFGGGRGGGAGPISWFIPGGAGQAGGAQGAGGTAGQVDPTAPGKDFSNNTTFQLAPAGEVRDVNEAY
jgi:hypothetical protein